MPNIILTLLTSKRFIAGVAGALLVLLNKHVPWLQLDIETVQSVVGMIIALIIGDSVRPIDPQKAADQQRRFRLVNEHRQAA